MNPTVVVSHWSIDKFGIFCREQILWICQWCKCHKLFISSNYIISKQIVCTFIHFCRLTYELLKYKVILHYLHDKPLCRIRRRHQNLLKESDLVCQKKLHAPNFSSQFKNEKFVNNKGRLSWGNAWYRHLFNFKVFPIDQRLVLY